MGRRFATFALRLRGWRLAGEVPPLPKYVVVLAPHTCNWDFPLAMLAASGYGIRLSWLGKHTIFRWPVARLLRGIGGIPVHRDRHDGMVGQVVEAFAARDTLVIGMTPEGTRTATPHWKSGFYHMARRAGVPIVLASLDRPTRRITLGPVVMPTGSPVKDMEAVRSFYAGARGIHPHKASAVRLVEEEGGGAF
jgi:1-acyl-sn-glycerol-3-phosphate acyltransferase